MRCRKAEKLVCSYVDGELGQRLGRALDAHLAECASCRALLADLGGIAEEAGTLVTPELSTDLWPGILVGARAARESREADVLPAAVALRRPSNSFLRPAAVTLGAIILIASGIWIGLRFNVKGPAVMARKADSTGYTLAKLDEAERYYQLAVKSLGEAFSAGRGEMPPGAFEVFEKNLSVVDTTINACRLAVKAQPYDLEARNFLLAAYLDKVSLLDSALGYEDQTIVRNGPGAKKGTI